MELAQRQILPWILHRLNHLRLAFRQFVLSIPRLFREYWDAALLGAIVLGIFGTIGWMLMPHPQLELTIRPVAGHELVATDSGYETLVPETISRPTRQPRRHKAKKAAIKPPILDINAASATQLDLLPGIGPALAGRIVTYRKSVGKFASIEQLNEVSGIGDKKLEKMRPYLRI